MTVTVNSGTEGKARGRMEGIVTHRSPPPRWLLHARWGVDHTPVHTAELKTQTAQRGWGTDGWKPTTAKAADTFTARYTGRIGQEHQGQGIGTSKDIKHIKPRCSQGCMHTCRETEVGIFHLCNHTANTTQVNQGGGPAATVQDGPGPQACLEDTLAVMGGV